MMRYVQINTYACCNYQVIEDVEVDRSGASRDFLCQLAREYIETKAKCKVSML
jgi:hypothetical protein